MNNKVDQFTVAVWLHRTALLDRDDDYRGVLYNADCAELGAFGIFAGNLVEGGEVTTEKGFIFVTHSVNIANMHLL